MKCPKKQSNTDKEYYETAFVYYMYKEKQSEAFLAVKSWAALALLSFFFLFCFTILLHIIVFTCVLQLLFLQKKKRRKSRITDR